jgi:glutathione S-transferase
MITVYGFSKVPPPVVGVTRELRVLWAAEEAGVSYRLHALDFARGDLRSAEYVAISPFGLVPAIDDDGVKLFESGAIVLYIAAKTNRLWPAEADARALASQWAFAALDTVEPRMGELFSIDKFHADKAWAKERRPAVVEGVQRRLAALDAELAGRAYLLGQAFTAPDILMCSALRMVQHTDLLDAVPNVAAYKARCESRSAWTRIYAAYEQRLAA